MNLHLKRPLAFFDLETTGTNVVTDRIVEVAVVKLLPGGQRESFVKRVNPTIPIPIESSLIHGIYDEQVKDAPTFRQLARQLADFIGDADLGGYNIVKFDLPLLVEEFLRAGIDFDTKNKRFVDVQKIFHMMEPRSLTAALKFYCNKELANAHSAEADTLATIDVFEAQLVRYENTKMKDSKGNEYIPIKNDVEAIHQLSAQQIVDWAGRIVLNEKGIPVFNFGKHKSVPVVEVLKREPMYYDWMMKGEFALNTKQKLTEIKLGMMLDK